MREEEAEMSFAITAISSTGHGALEEQPASDFTAMYILQLARNISAGNMTAAQRTLQALESQVRSAVPSLPLAGPASSSVNQYLQQLNRAVNAGEVSSAQQLLTALKQHITKG